MKKDFELSRRDPAAHNALVIQRREEEARKLHQHVASFPPGPGISTHPSHSTQPVIINRPEQTDGQRRKATPAAEHNSGDHQSGSDFMSGDRVDRADTEGKMNGSKEKREGRKRSLSADDEHASKKAKREPAFTPAFAAAEAVRKTFQNLLSREAARHSKGGS